MDIAFCFDDHLALAGMTAIMSLLETQRGPVRLHVFADRGTVAAPLLQSLARRYGTELAIHDASDESRHGFDSASDYGRPSVATYRRLQLADWLPAIDRLIYLDADLIVRRDLQDLWAEDLNGLPIGAVMDPWMPTIPGTCEEFSQGYFNAGVLLFDLALWRRERLTDSCLAEIERRQGRASASGGNALGYRCDQTPLNAVLNGRWKSLPPKWNATAYLTPRLAAQLSIPSAELREALEDPAIFHFLGAHKPWVEGLEDLGPRHREFNRFRRQLEQRFECSMLVKPGPFTNGPAAARNRRFLAMRLVAEAISSGLERPFIVLTGLLAPEISIVAREKKFPVGGFVSESPAHEGGVLHGLSVLTMRQALDQGIRDFIIGDYRRLERTRDWVRNEATCRNLPVRILDVGKLDRVAA